MSTAETLTLTRHSADTRGKIQWDWLNTKHSFSFGEYYNPERMHFGVLRVLNDDTVAGGKGFGFHPHKNMEIITIPLAGDIHHRDNMNNSEIIKNGDIQVMSAGRGVMHSEFNAHADTPVSLLQIWILPNKIDVEPRYEQMSIQDIITPGKFSQILSPSPDDAGVWIHQEAWFSLYEPITLNSKVTSVYCTKGKNHGVYAFVIEGSTELTGLNRNNTKPTKLMKRDGLGISGYEQNDELTFRVGADTRLLLMEVPLMNLT